jgi:phosphate transport system substrate-binding protein
MVAAAPAMALDISGAGATFPYPIYAKWADVYKKETGIGMNYQSIGSGGGIKQIEARRPRLAPLTRRSRVWI